jgi:hypothetical protein
MRDPELEAYVASIETHLSRRRGVDRPLTPKDFQLACSWYGARLPLNTVLAGIDDAFAAGAAPSSLSFCRPFVEALVRPPGRA